LKQKLQNCQQLHMINSMANAASNMKQKSFFSTPEYKKILQEATSNENWNISNSKL